MPRMTVQTRMVLDEFLKVAADTELYGFEIKAATGLAPGTLYPLLRRLEDAGWLTSRWELCPAGNTGRVRCYYTLTPAGASAAREVQRRSAILQRQEPHVPRGHPKDLTGQRFTNWTVLAKDPVTKPGKLYWLCECDCGADVSVRSDGLLSGRSKRCRSCAVSARYNPRWRSDVS